MTSQHREIRSMLAAMSPKRAIQYIKSFELPAEEELFIIECDIRRKSHVQAAEEFHTSPEVIKRRRSSAYRHMADYLNHQSF